ncbi:MAG: hypothetical protein Kow0090_04630 [Myxococcota bacterium]
MTLKYFRFCTMHTIRKTFYPLVLILLLISSVSHAEKGKEEIEAEYETVSFLGRVALVELEGGETAKMPPPTGLGDFPEPWRLLVLARINIARGDLTSASELLTKIVLTYPAHPASDYAKGYLGAIDVMRGNFRDARQTLKTVVKQISVPAISAEFNYLLARSLKKSAPEEALGIAEEGFLTSTTFGARRGWKLLAEEIIDSSVSFIDVRRLYEERGAGYVFRDILTLKLARILLHINEFGEARKKAEEYLRFYPFGEMRERAREVAEFLKELTDIKEGVFGVLLPLTGKYGDYGHKVLNAMKLALIPLEELEKEVAERRRLEKELSSALADGSETEDIRKSLDGLEASDGYEITGKNYKFIFRDTEADPIKAAKAFEELVRKDKVVAVLGPLFSSTSVAVAYKAEELGTVMLSLSRKENLTSIGKNVFRNCLTSRREAYTLADYMINKLNLKRFAILAPEHPYGLEMAQLFWDAVEEFGGEIRGYETYEQDAKTFSAPIKRLVGKYYLEARRQFHDERWQKLKGLEGFRRLREIGKIAKNLPPVVDFDALFIPDYYQTVSLVAPAVAFEDVIIYTESQWHIDRIRKTLGRWNLDMVRLIGGSGWNSPELIERGEQYVRNSIFVDGFYPQSEDKTTATFVNDYRALFGKAPNIMEAQAYESAALFANIAEKSKPKSRAEFRIALKSVKDFPGATGKLSFDESGEVVKELYVLTVVGDKIRLMDEVLEEKEKAGTQKN